jgi:hypothetical protein
MLNSHWLWTAFAHPQPWRRVEQTCPLAHGNGTGEPAFAGHGARSYVRHTQRCRLPSFDPSRAQRP